MGRIIKGANGGFSGKAGSVIGSSWRGISYIRGIGKKSSKPATAEQLAVRSRFEMLTAILGKVKKLLEIGFGTSGLRERTGYNCGILRNYNAFTGAFPNLSIDYAKLMFSKGGCTKPISTALELVDKNNVSVSWDLQNVASADHETEDLYMYVLVHNQEKAMTLQSEGDVKWGDAKALFAIPDAFAGDTLHAYLFVKNRANNSVSDTLYVGQTQVF